MLTVKSCVSCFRNYYDDQDEQFSKDKSKHVCNICWEERQKNKINPFKSNNEYQANE